MKVVVLSSGGKESLATFEILKSHLDMVGLEGPVEIHSLYVDLGWRNSTSAKAAAAKFATAYGASHEVVKLEGDWQRPKTADLKHNAGVYHQGVLLHTIGGAYAAKHDIPYVVSGVQPGPITSPSNFADILKNLYAVAARWEPPEKIPQFLFPVAYLTLGQLLTALKDNPLLTATVSCNEEPACGTCQKCNYRAALLHRLGVGPEPLGIHGAVLHSIMNVPFEPLVPGPERELSYVKKVELTPVAPPDPEPT